MIKKLAKKLYGTNSVFYQPKYHGYRETASANEIDTKEILNDIFSDIDIFERYKIIVAPTKFDSLCATILNVTYTLYYTNIVPVVDNNLNNKT